jgi:hypothetical protein
MRKRLLFLVVEDALCEMVMLWQGFFRPRAASPLHPPFHAGGILPSSQQMSFLENIFAPARLR